MHVGDSELIESDSKEYNLFMTEIDSPDNHELGKTVDQAYLFDVDGPLSHPDIKHPTIEGNLDAIASKLGKNEPVAFNTGRSLSWMIDRVIAPLILKIDDKSALQNFIAVGEKGGTWITFDNNGKMTEHRDDSISVPFELQDRVRNLVNSEFSDTTFFDESKLTMISAEMLDSLKDRREDKYRPAQHQITQRLEIILKEMGLDEDFKIDPTTIATDIENKHVGKDFAVRRILDWLNLKGIKPAEFIAFGDSASDIPMAEELHNQGHQVKFVYVGDKQIDFSKYRFPVIQTSDKFESGTLEYLNQK